MLRLTWTTAAARLLLIATLSSAAWACSLPSAYGADSTADAESGPLLRFVPTAPAKEPDSDKAASDAPASDKPPSEKPASEQPGGDDSIDGETATVAPPKDPPTPPVRPVRKPDEPSATNKQSDADAGSDFDDVLDVAPSDSADPTPRSLTTQQSALRDQIRRTLARYYHRPVNARDHSPWEVFHWVIAYNVDSQIYTRGPGGDTASAVGWLCYNYPCRGQRLLALDHGRPTARYGVGLEGHPGQFLAILAQSRVMKDYPLRVDGRQFTVADLVETTKLNCNSKRELTFQLIGLSHYLDLDETWKSRTGETWSIPRLIREEIASPIRGSACGGTHRLMGLTYCVRKREMRGQPIDGEYLRAKTYIDDYIQFTLRMQNPDGSFSTEWFAGRGARPDIDRRIQTTGHILEWMVFAADKDQLDDPRIVKSVDYLSKTMLAHETRDWKIGPLGHALRSLSLYDRRLFKPLEERPAAEVARRERRAKRIAAEPPPPSIRTEAKRGDKPVGNPSTKSSRDTNEKEKEVVKPSSSRPPSKPAGNAGPLLIVPSSD